MRVIQRRIVVGLLMASDGKILLGKTASKAGAVYSGAWKLPGGGVEEGETDKQAIIREISEETHHDISALNLELIDGSGSGSSEKTLPKAGERVIVEMEFYVFKVVLKETSTQLGTKPSKELIELKWFSKEELSNANLATPADELLTKLGYKEKV